MVENPKEGGKSYERDTYFWHYPYNVQVYNPVDDLPLTPHSAIRKGHYKLIYDWSGRLWLYDLEKDVSETVNLAKTQPKLAQTLFAELNGWLEDNVEAKYLPTLNPEYDAGRDQRDYPFVDLREKYLGEAYSIGAAPGFGKGHLEK